MLIFLKISTSLLEFLNPVFYSFCIYSQKISYISMISITSKGLSPQYKHLSPNTTSLMIFSSLFPAIISKCQKAPQNCHILKRSNGQIVTPQTCSSLSSLHLSCWKYHFLSQQNISETLSSLSPFHSIISLSQSHLGFIFSCHPSTSQFQSSPQHPWYTSCEWVIRNVSQIFILFTMPFRNLPSKIEI